MAFDLAQLFGAPVARWFRARHGQPTEPQREAWPCIKRGQNVLIHSPTGSGKTLAAFLSALDDLYSDVDLHKTRGVRTLYVSPLKALGYDIERNLEEPMAGIARSASELGIDIPQLEVAVRTGDTPSSERARMVRNPPHILITTPESLYLILTSPRARSILSTVKTVIIDEIHTMCATKRGVHLSITLERLEQIAPNFQRVGLSATQRPLSEVAKLLGGQSTRCCEGAPEAVVAEPRPVQIVDCPGSKSIEIEVKGMPELAATDGGSVWPKIIPQVLDDIEAHDTTLIFANSRRQAENTADRLNAAYDARMDGEDSPKSVGSGHVGSGVEDGPFMAHHGSLSDSMRRHIESRLKAGELPALVGTSSLELGIDIGSVDLVVQLQSPKSVTQGLQRVGRAGHSVGATSHGKIYATHAIDLIEAVVVAKGMQERRVESIRVPQNALDVLAQQVVAAVAIEDWKLVDLYRIVRGAYPYSNLTYSSFEDVVNLVSGHYPRELFSSLRARIHWDRTRGILQALPGTRVMAIANGGAIVDRGAFAVTLPDRKTRIGELDEEFVYESGEGDVFMLGSQIWRISKIEDDRVVAEPAPGAAPRLPFWRGDFPWRPLDLAQDLARFRSEVAKRIEPFVDDESTPAEVVAWLQNDYPVDYAGACQIVDFIRDQLRNAGDIASHETIVFETYQDPIGDHRIVVHSPFGGRINGPWSVAVARELTRKFKIDAEARVSDDGFMFRLPESDTELGPEIIRDLTAEVAKSNILDGMIDSPLFGAVFRQNAYRAMLLPSLGQHRRTPFWLQRLRSKDLLSIAKSFPDFPIVLESYRDALEDFMDMSGLEEILDAIQSGDMRVRHVESTVPSTVARAMEFDFIGQFMYEWDTPKAERSLQTLNIDRAALAQLFRNPEAAGLLRKEAIEDVTEIANRSAPGMDIRSETELAQTLEELGDLSDREIDERCQDEWRRWIANLLQQERVQSITFEQFDDRWVASTLAPAYRDAIGDASSLESTRNVTLRFIRRNGPTPFEALSRRYGFDDSVLRDVLANLVDDGVIAQGHFTDGEVEEWVDVSALERIQQRTLSILRSEVEPADPLTYQLALMSNPSIGEPEHSDGSRQLEDAIEVLQGVALPPEQWIRHVLPARTVGFRASHLDSAIRDGEFQWVFCESEARSTRALALVKPGEARAILPEQTLESIRTGATDLAPDAQAVFDFISQEGVATSQTILSAIPNATPTQLAQTVKDLALAGLVTADSWPVAMAIGRAEAVAVPEHDVPEPRNRRIRHRLGRRNSRRAFMERRHHVQGILTPGVRWSTTSRFSFLGPDLSADQLNERRARILLARHGIVTRRAIELDRLGWVWRAIYAQLSLMELKGQVRRGYFVVGLPGVQFGDPEFVESMRSEQDRKGELTPSVISATDPAYVFDSALATTSENTNARLLNVSRNPGTHVVFLGGDPVLVAHAEGRRIVTADVVESDLKIALHALVDHLSPILHSRNISVGEWNGESVFDSEGLSVLSQTGFRRDFPNMVMDRLAQPVTRS